MPGDFVHLHTHSSYSTYDGLGMPHEFIELAAEMGQPAIALTEHGSLRSIFPAAKAAKEHGIKYIPAVEAYLCDDATQRGLTEAEKRSIKEKHGKEEGARRIKVINAERKERDHITIWALTDEGLRNLFKLTAWSWTKGFHFKPRIDLDVLERHQAGLAVSSGCPGGVITKPLRAGDVEEATKRTLRLAEVFGDRFYFEIMPHVPDKDCIGLAKKLVTMADSLGARYITTQDAHYPGACDAEVQDVLLCVNTKKRIDDPDRMRFDAHEYWLKSRSELADAFERNVPQLSKKTVSKGMDETLAFAERVTCEVEFAKPGAHLAAPELPEGIGNYNEWLMSLCAEGAQDRLPGADFSRDSAYGARLRHELGVIRGLGFSSYFVLAWDLRRWCRDNGILCGPGRGSAAGSLVCYLLRITDLDPIEHKLMFERFMSPDRNDIGDVDLDFAHDRRGDIIDHLRMKYGEDKVAHIQTHIRLKGRGALNALGRVFAIPDNDIAPVTAQIHNAQAEEDEDEESLATALKETSAGREFSEQYPDAAAVAARLEGNVYAIGRHAGGIVISDEPLAEITPIETVGSTGDTGGEGRVVVTAYDMHGVEGSGLVKLDVLGLKTLSILRRAFAESGHTPADIDFSDEKVINAFTEGRFAGIFQFDTPSARRLCTGFEFTHFGNIPALTALNRPGPLKTGLAERYMDRSTGKEDVPEVHPIYDEVFADTYGVPVYQEQVIMLAREFGYTPSEADKFRKKIAKKLGLADEHDKFVEGAIGRGVPKPQAEKLFSNITGFAAYSFNRAHSYCYGALAFWSMWLKVYAPAEFYAASLEVRGEDQDGDIKQLRLAAEARDLGIPVLPPNINHPSAGFAIHTDDEGTAILGGISDIKGVGEVAAKVIAERAPYTDLRDFYDRAGSRPKLRSGKVDKSVQIVSGAPFVALAKADAFRDIFPHTRFLAANAKKVWDGLKSGRTPEVAETVRDFEEHELAECVGEVWPIFRSVGGVSAFTHLLGEIRERWGRDIHVPGEDVLLEPGGYLVLARPAKFQIFGSPDGTKSGRAIVVSSDGDELVLRVPDDQSHHAPLFEGDDLLLIFCRTNDNGRSSVQGVWPAKPDSIDPLAKAWLRRTGPDTARRINRLGQGQMMNLEATILHVRRHQDKKGGRMLTWSCIVSRSYLRVLIFASRVADDVKGVKVGDKVKFRAEVLDGGALTIISQEVRKIGSVYDVPAP